MKPIVPALMAAASALAGPAFATTYMLDYSGSASFQPPRGSPVTINETGSGLFATDVDTGALTLADLTGFTFTTDRTDTSIVYGVGPVTSDLGTLSYGLADLVELSGTVSHGQITSLSFRTGYKTANYEFGTGQFFFDDYNGSGATVGGGAAPHGPVTVTASVPEPAAWLTMLAGFGMIGAGVRRRRRSALQVA